MTIMNQRTLTIYLLFFLLGSLSAFADTNSLQNPNLQKADIFFLKSEFDSSLNYLNLAELYFNRIGKDSMVAEIANRKARIYMLNEQSNHAITILKTNQNFIRKRFGELNEMMALCNDLVGDYYMSILDADAALMYYQKSLNIRTKLYHYNHPRIAFSYSNLSRYYSFKIERDSAFYFAEKAYKMFSLNPESSNHFQYERIFTEYAYAFKIFHLHKGANQSKTLQETRGLYSKALGFINKKYGINSFASAAVYRNIGNTYTDILLGFQGKPKLRSVYFMKAMNFYDKSLSIYSTYVKGYSSAISTVYYVKGILYEYSYEKDSSEKCLLMYDKAISALIPTYRFNNILSESELKTCASKYELMTTIFTKSFYYYKLYNITGNKEHLKYGHQFARNMIPLWNYIIDEFESPYTNRLIGIYNQRIFNFLVELTWQLHAVEPKIGYLEDIVYFSQQSKGSLQNRLLMDAISHVDKSWDSSVVTPSDIQKALPNHETGYIEFFDTTMVIGIRKDQFLVKKLNENINQDSLLKVYQMMLRSNNPKVYQKTAHLIYQTYFEPILSSIGKDIKYLIIASDGMISKVAVSSLVTDTIGSGNDFRQLKYVGLKYSIRHVLSANDLLRNIKNNYNEPGTLIGFAPDFHTNSSLPFSQSLVQNLQEKVKGDYFLYKNGSKENFLNYAPKHRVIQLSTHAEADLGEMMESKIYFSDEDEKSNFITLDSIYKMKFNTQLAILSACETNVGRMEYGEGSLNFSRAFLYAGCNSTITTQWKVDDKTTSGILMEFYNQLLNKNYLSIALQKAQLNYLKNCGSSAEANPFFWSALVVTGDDSPVYLRENSNSFAYGVIGFSTLLIFAGLYKFRQKREQAPKS